MKSKEEILAQYKEWVEEGVISQERFERIHEWYIFDKETNDLNILKKQRRKCETEMQLKQQKEYNP